MLQDTIATPQNSMWSTPVWEWTHPFFEHNTLMQSYVSLEQHGVAPIPLEQPYPELDTLVGIVVACLAVLALLINYSRQFLHLRAKDFFYTTDAYDVLANEKAAPPSLAVAVAYLLLSVAGSLLALHYALGTQALHFYTLTPLSLLGIYAGCFVLTFAAKRLLSGFINWIFFDRASRLLWRLDYNFLLIAETALLLPVAAAAFCFGLPAGHIALATLSVVAIIKLLLLYKAFETFLPRIYGIVHLLSYLCALEIIPFLALCLGLEAITEQLK